MKENKAKRRAVLLTACSLGLSIILCYTGVMERFFRWLNDLLLDWHPIWGGVVSLAVILGIMGLIMYTPRKLNSLMQRVFDRLRTAKETEKSFR